MYAIPEFPNAKNVNGPIPFKSPLPINKGIDAPKVRAAPSLVLSNDGTVYDAARKITWLANANLAATQTFGVPNINPDGSMDYHTATAWIDAVNKANDGMGYLGHTDWRLPVSNDSHGDYDIASTDMGELFYTELGSKAGSTILLTHDQYASMFLNFQPYLYWSSTPTMNNPGDDGHSSFSFGNGFQGSEFDADDLYVIPVFGPPASNLPPVPTGANDHDLGIRSRQAETTKRR
jgi:hypothetical protein